MPVTNKLDLPEPFVEAATQSHTYTPKRYSVTSLLKGTRETVLTRRHADEIETDAADSVWLIFGKAVHSILENSTETPSQIKENFITADMDDGYTLSGVFDLYDDATGTVTDYKTAVTMKWLKKEFDDYRMQTLIYCWILRKIGFNAHRGEIVMLLKDHSKSKAKLEADYPKHPVQKVSFDFTEHDFTSIHDWLVEKFAEIKRCEKLDDSELPVCSEEQRWHRPDTYAVMKKGRKRALKLYSDETEALEHAIAVGGYVEFRPGSDQKCESYCSCKDFCNYYKEHVLEGVK